MKLHRVVTIVMLIAFGLIPLAFGQTVRTDYDRRVNFSGYRTYSWGNIETKSPLWADRIRSEVGVALTGKGWKWVSTGGDVSVTALEITSQHSTLDTNYRSSQDWDVRRERLLRKGIPSRHAHRELVRSRYQEDDLARIFRKHVIQ